MSWDRPPERIRELLRIGAELLVQHKSGWLDEFTRTFLSSPGMEVSVSEPVLAAESERAARATILRWAVSNISDPGAPVAPVLDADIVDITRDLVRRGLDELTVTSYRIGQNAAWKLWVRLAFSLTSEVDELEALLIVSAQSIGEFVEATLAMITELIHAEREELLRGSAPERREVVALLLEGAPITRERAEMRLGYDLSQTHTAAIAWHTQPDSELRRLEQAVGVLVKCAQSPNPLTIIPGAATIWVWLPGEVTVDAQTLAERVRDIPDVCIAVGSTARGIEGFRRTHLDALSTQQMLTRLRSSRRVATYDEVRLVSLLAADHERTDHFIHHTLGDLANESDHMRETVLTYVREQCSVARTAARLHVHRNTVIRRLARADELLPRPLDTNTLHIAAALEVLQWRGAT
ncbi:PucR family transcriptional regulator [Nocardia asiatica]|uniref:PucR family transcriptional regulator n=1 Tax=Nocardia asiatica TaxID=209252 RepID=UPI0024584663|nr:helix-turn-helix domain-containing protein [Nocardia asiatica]